jgi:hypothetical protein
MARGWESKSVEDQQADLEEKRRKPVEVPSTEDAERLAKRRTLELARTRALSDLQRACSPAHRAMLEAAIQALDAQLKG